MKNDYEEIYDQAGFFQEVWEQLPETFRNPTNKDKKRNDVLESYSMVIYDTTSSNKTELVCKKCKSVNVTYDGICLICKDCGAVECSIQD